MDLKKHNLDYKKIEKRIGNNIFKLRKDNKLSLEEASDKTQISSKLLDHMEKGNKVNSLSNLVKVANAYNVDISKLFKK